MRIAPSDAITVQKIAKHGLIGWFRDSKPRYTYNADDSLTQLWLIRLTALSRFFLFLFVTIGFLGFTGRAESGTQSYTASTTWTAPAGVTSVTAEVWGGGGGGGGQGSRTSDGGGGGGGGAYSKKTAISVTPGNNYTVTVGTGGAGGAGGTGACGVSGGDSWFVNSTTVLAKGGVFGCHSTGTPPAGGLGGSSGSGVGDVGFKFSGGNGGKGRDSNTGRGGPGGSSAGTAANGTSGATTWSTTTAAAAPTGGGQGGDGGAANTDGSAGTVPGGGGGGSGEVASGGDGAAGQVILNWAPTVSSVAISSATGTQNSTLNAGDVVSATVTMSEAVTVTGTPQLALNISGTTVQADYSSGSGTSALVFTYTILAGQNDANGISIGANSLTLNSGTIQDSVGNAATLTHSLVADNANYMVDTTAPSIPSITSVTDDQGTITGTVANNGRTDDTQPVVRVSLSGTNAVSGDTVQLYNSGSALGAATTITGTNITNAYVDITTTSLSDGSTYVLTAKVIDAAGNTGTASTSYTISIDTSAPTLSSVVIASNNASSAWAKTGNTVTLTFTANESVQATPTVTIAGQSVTPSPAGPSAGPYTATYTMVAGDTEGVVPFTINFVDLAGNAGTQVTATTNSSTVTFDKTAPTIPTATIASNNTNPIYATVGDIVTLSFTTSDTNSVQTPVVTIAGASASVSGGPSAWTATHTMLAGDTQGSVAFTINVNDTAGNAATARTDITSGANVTFMLLPTVTTNAASGITSWVATLNGTVSSNGTESTIGFEYGLTNAYGESITYSQNPLAANAANTAVSEGVEGLNCNTTFHYRVVAANTAGTTYGNDQSFTTSACTPPYPAEACAATRYGSDLNCSAQDVKLTNIALAPGSSSSCISGIPVTLDLDLTVNFSSPERWDVGIYIANDGKLPTLLSTHGGASSCSVDVLPTTSPFLDLDGTTSGNPTGDTCGDGNNSISGVKRMSNVTLPCQASPNSAGKMYVPYTISWDSQRSPVGSLCTSNLYPVPKTSSKCNAPGDSVAIDVVVLPVITKTDGITTINPGANTSYSVVIFNNSGGVLLDSVFKDPAVTNLTVNSVSCAPAGGATCPTATVAAMQGSGITIPSASLPNNSSLTFTVNGTLSGSATEGDNLVNTATVSIGSATNTATDTDLIVNTPSVAKSFAPGTITEGAGSVLTVTLTNPTVSSVTGVAFTDTYPSGLVNTASANGTTSCGGTVTAANGGNSLALSGGTIAANSSCTVTVNVSSSTAATYTNSTGTVTTDSGNISAASGILTVNPGVYGGFNACDVGTTCTNATTSTDSHIKTKTAGSAFSLDLVALKTDGSRNTSYNNSVTVELLDASDNSGAVDSYNCRSSWTPIITTLSPNPAFANNNNGLITVGSFTVAEAYKDVRVRITNSGGSFKKGCSTDNFAIKPNSLTVVPSDTDWQTAGTVRTLNNTDATNSGSASSTPYPIHKVGYPFTITATAKNAANVTTSNYASTVTSVVSACSGGTACTASLGTLTLGTASTASGVGTWNSASYSKVGAFDLTLEDTLFATVDSADTTADCTGYYVCSAATSVGRFIVDTAVNSTVVASPISVAADGTTTSTITVTLLDSTGAPVTGKTVTLAAGSGSSIISAASGVSDASGIVTFTVTDSTAEGPITYTATNVTDATVITQTAQVTFIPVTTLATGSDPAAATIAPGAGATDVDFFTLQTSSGTEEITTVTVNLSTNSGVGRLAVTNNSGTELGFTASPVTGSNVITVTGMSATTTLTNFKVRVTPLSHAGMPVPPGALYAITAPVTAWAGLNVHTGSDTNTNALTIDNLSPASATKVSSSTGDGNVTLNWTTSADADFTTASGSVVYRWAAGTAGTEVPAEGITPVVGSANGTATVACVVSSASSSTDVVGRIDGSGGSTDCTTDALTNGQVYTYKVFQKDASGNYDTGEAMGMVRKSFNATSIFVNGTSTLTIAIYNPGNTAISGLAFTDTYPSNLINAATPTFSNTCGGTATGTAAGDNILSLSGGTVAAGGSCSISISVTSTTIGSYNNSTLVTWTNSGNGATASAILTVMPLILDHLQIDHDGEGSNCAAESVTVKACSDANCSTLATVGGITATLQPFGSAINIGVSGSVSLTVNPSSTGTNTLSATSISPVPTNITATCLNTVTSAASCSMAVSACSSGFDCLETGLSYGSGRLYTKLTGTDFNFDVVALNSSNAVETNYVAAGAAAKNVTVELFDDSTPAASCGAYASPVASQTLSFDSTNAGRKTTANFNVANAYAKLRCRVTDANATGCSSDDFAVRPQSFTLSTTAALDPDIDKLAAGEDFNLTADPGVTIGYTGTPAVDTAKVVDYVSPTPNAVNSTLKWDNPTLPQPGSAAASGFPQAAGGSVSNNFQYHDVGTITFNADAVTDSGYTVVDQSSDCVVGSTSNTADNGKFGCTIGSSAMGPIGRFHPHHFAVNASFTPGCSGGFTYMDHDALGITLNVTAQSKDDTAVRLYETPASTYVPLATLGIELLNGASTTDLLPRLSQPSMPSRVWTAGIYTADGVYRFDARNLLTPVMDGAYDSLKIRATITDATDSVKITKLNGTTVSQVSSIDSPTTRVRFGRISLQNAYGSELLDLPIPVQAQYWNGSSFVTNDLDNCTSLADSNIGFGNYQSSLDASNIGVLTFRAADNAGSCTANSTATGNMIAGKSCILFSKPTTSATGSVDLLINLGSSGVPGNCLSPALASGSSAGKSYLSGNWCGDGSYIYDPTARATFGVYKGNSKFIYIREQY